MRQFAWVNVYKREFKVNFRGAGAAEIEIVTGANPTNRQIYQSAGLISPVPCSLFGRAWVLFQFPKYSDPASQPKIVSFRRDEKTKLKSKISLFAARSFGTVFPTKYPALLHWFRVYFSGRKWITLAVRAFASSLSLVVVFQLILLTMIVSYAGIKYEILPLLS